MAGRKRVAGPVADFRVHLTGAAAEAWNTYKSKLVGPAPTDSAIGAFLVAVALGVEKMPRERRKAG